MRKILVIPALAIALLTGGLAYAAIPDASGVIHGCYKVSNPGKGAVIVIDSEAGGSCPSGFAPLSWNHTGPQGPAGPGGPPGPAASVGYEAVRVAVPSIPDGSPPEYVAVSCPVGKYGVDVYRDGNTPEDPQPAPPGRVSFVIDGSDRITGARFLKDLDAYEGVIVCVNG